MRSDLYNKSLKFLSAGVVLSTLALFTAALFAAPPEASAQTTVNFCSRSPQIVDRIRSKLSMGAMGCEGDLSGITGTLSLSRITSLKSGDFDDMSGVTKIVFFSSSSLTSLPASPFDEMTSLTHLTMNSTGVTALPTGMFDNLDSMSRIRLPALTGNTPFTLNVKAETAPGAGAGAHRRGPRRCRSP